MGRTPRGRYDTARKKLADEHEKGHVSDAEHDAIHTFLAAFDGENMTEPLPPGQSAKSANTLALYVGSLRLAARRIDTDLTEATARDVNNYLQGCLDGNEPEAPDDGLSTNTVMSYSGGLRMFYRYHAEFGVNSMDISMPKGKAKNTVDENDMFTREEIQAMRDGCTNTRDRCLLELLLSTGQRIRALQTLRIKDVSLEDSRYRLNPEADGLKSAQGYRPLLMAETAVRDWLRMHPESKNPDAYLLTWVPSYGKSDATETLSVEAIRDALRAIAKRAGISKPVHPHNFRHNAVTMFKRDYEMDDDEIKFLIGHAPSSNVMETTYSHLSDEDLSQKAEISVGIRDPDKESPLTPETCDTCGEPLPPDAKACPKCGTVFAPNAQSAMDALEKIISESEVEAAWQSDKDRMESARRRRKLLEDPEFREKAMNQLTDSEIASLIERARQID